MEFRKHIHRLTCGVIVAILFAPSLALGAIPATPLMTVYQFNGALTVPYYRADRFAREGPKTPAGSLTQGTSVIPCLVVRAGKPLTDGSGTPFVGFTVVVDANRATPDSTAAFAEVFAQRKATTVADHRCSDDAEFVIDVRKLYSLGKPPSFDPPRGAPAPVRGGGIDAIVRAFHDSEECADANRRLIGRRDALQRAWSRFSATSADRWPADSLARARQLDFVMRTALYEGHLGRGCSSYGACERNAIAVSIRNRALERCLRGQGCSTPGDFEGVAAKVSQYNIWDEFLTQTSGLTSCFLRPDLAGHEFYGRLQAMYAQSSGDVARILFGGEGDLRRLFPGTDLADVTRLHHYYHPPAMGKCFPPSERLEYISGAVARRDEAFALIANTRIRVGAKRGAGYLFQQAVIEERDERDIVRGVEAYPGFVIDGRKVALAAPSRCTPYGTPRGCKFEQVGRHRRTPSWLASGQPLQLNCRVRAGDAACQGEALETTTKLGGVCDTQMQPVAGVP